MSRKQRFIFIALIVILATGLGRLFLNAPIANIEFAAETVGNDIFGKWNITNSLIAAWAAMGVLILLAVLATRKMQLVPRGFQNFAEAVVGWLLGLTEDIAGRSWGRKFFPLVATLFFFIVIANWSALIPVFGTIGKVEPAEVLIAHEIEEVVGDLNENRAEGMQFPEHYAQGERPPEAVVTKLRREIGDKRLTIFDGTSGVRILPVGFGKVKEIRLGEYWDFDAIDGEWLARTGTVPSDENEVNVDGKTVGILLPYLRSMNTDLMNTLAMALIVMFMVQYWGIQANGFRGYMSRFINFKEGPVGFAVGLLEGISEVARLISFSFRLLGNMFAGEVLIFAFLFLLPVMAGVFIMPFILETFVGFIQGVIFAVLALIFATLAVRGHQEQESGGH